MRNLSVFIAFGSAFSTKEALAGIFSGSKYVLSVLTKSQLDYVFNPQNFM